MPRKITTSYLIAGASASGTARDLRKFKLRLLRSRRRTTCGRLRVLIDVPEYPPSSVGGSEQSIRAVARFLAGAGHRVTVVADDAEAPYQLDGIAVVPPGSRRTLRARYREADVAISQRRTALRSQMLAAATGIPFTLCVRDIGEWNRLPAMPDLTVFNAKFQRDLFEFQARSVVVYPPVDIVGVATTRGDRVTLMNMNQRKGATLFLEIVARMPSTQFLAVTGLWGEQILPDQPLPNLEIVQPVQDPREIYRRTRVLLLPSVWESFGRVVVEAGASGIPVVATPNPGTLEALGDAAMYASGDDIEDWVSAIRRLDDEAEYLDWSSRVHRAVQRFDSTDQLSALESKLREIASS